MDEKGLMDKEIWNGLFEQGFMAVETPTELGGPGMSFMSAILVIEGIV